MIKLFLTLAALTISDPVPGPAGAAGLIPPSDVNYRSLAPFDLTDISLLEGSQIGIALQMASWANPFGLENGFSHPVIEVYIGGGEFGSPELLPGSGMRLSEGEEWSVALRLTGDRAWGYEVTATGMREFEPALEMADGWLYVSTDAAAPENPGIAAMTGLYSPFHVTGWRPLADEPSPWAFSSDSLVLPVVDVLALTEEAQLAALSTGVLPVTQVSTVPRSNTIWLALMAVGIALAGAGLLWRNAAGRQKVRESAAAAAVQAETEGELPAREAAALTASLVSADREAVLNPAADPDPEEVPEEPQVKVGYFRGASQEEVEAVRARLQKEAEPTAETEAPAAEPESSTGRELDKVIDELRASILAETPDEDTGQSEEAGPDPDRESGG